MPKRTAFDRHEKAEKDARLAPCLCPYARTYQGILFDWFHSTSDRSADPACHGEKRKKQGKWVETLSFSDLDETAEDYKFIQQTFWMDDYENEAKQEVFNRFFEKITYRP